MVTIDQMNKWNALQRLIADRARRAALAAAVHNDLAKPPSAALCDRSA